MMNWAEYEEEQPPRATISPYWAIAAVILGVGLALASWKVYAESLIARGVGGDWVRIFDEPCPGTPAWFKLQRAEMLYQGKTYTACWRSEGGGVLIFDDNGDISLVPLQAFQKDEGV